MAVSIVDQQARRIRRTPLLQAARKVLVSEGAPRADVSLLLTDDATVRELNCAYRHQDRPTDVLSFSQRDDVPDAPPVPPAPGAERLLGDVIISVDAAARQAAARHVPLEKELALLTVHGILHLLGYDDETEEGAERMRSRERAALGGP